MFFREANPTSQRHTGSTPHATRDRRTATSRYSHPLLEEVELHGQDDGQQEQAGYHAGPPDVHPVDDPRVAGDDEADAVKDPVLEASHQRHRSKVCGRRRKDTRQREGWNGKDGEDTAAHAQYLRERERESERLAFVAIRPQSVVRPVMVN